MANLNDLKIPLKIKRPSIPSLPDRLRLRINKNHLLVGLMLVGLFGAAGWVRIAGDPLGGEPTAMLALNTEDKPSTISGAGSLRMDVISNDGSATLPLTQSADAENATTGQGIETEMLDGGAKVIIINPDQDTDQPSLATVPDNRLVERTELGLLPMRSEDGATPMAVYAKPVRNLETRSSSARPRIAIMVNAMGLNPTQSTEALRRLPSEVSLAYAPYASNLQEWVSRSRQDGHEVLLQIPMEPFDFPDNDPGPHTLLTSLTPEQNFERLHWVMTRMVGYAGVTNFMGARFTASREMMRPFILELKKRGLLYVDDGTSPRSLAEDLATEVGLPARRANITLDSIPSPEAIGAALERLEIAAIQEGIAVGVISALPVSIQTVSDWVEGLAARGIDLIPVSAATQIVAAEG